jgi:AraC-like DNA-binding protein
MISVVWVTLVGIGFSIGVSALLCLALATTYRYLQMTKAARFGGYCMLIGLAATQWQHGSYLFAATEAINAKLADTNWLELVNTRYAVILMLQSTGFYWLFLGLLRPPTAMRLFEWLLPTTTLFVVVLLPPALAIPVAMLFGTVAAAHLSRLVYQLRSQRRWFALERNVLLAFGMMGLLIALTSVATIWLGSKLFVLLYANLISLSFGLVMHLLLHYPELAQKTEEAVNVAYAVTTLSKVDCEKALVEMKRLFEQEHIYRDENLSLSKLAEQTRLSAHQLSELINTQLQMSFSKLVRQYRIDAAKAMLRDEPRASVLSVGLSVGFSSQSNFYSAFKEQTGTVPSRFRSEVGAVLK